MAGLSPGQDLPFVGTWQPQEERLAWTPIGQRGALLLRFGMAYFVSITRLRIRSLRFMPSFALQTVSTMRQVTQADGFLGGSLLPDRRWTFWTMTVWRDATAMRAYMKTGSHLKAMPKLMQWCDEASVVHWEQDDAEAPSWTTADQRMRVEGRPSKVRWPSTGHGTLVYREPKASRARPIAVRQARSVSRSPLSAKLGG